MGVVKQINTKNRTYYFYNHKIKDFKDFKDLNIKDFGSKVLKIDKNHTKTLVFTILDILLLKNNDDCENIYCESFVFIY